MIWFGLIWFYGISTIVDYLMTNPFLIIYMNYFQTHFVDNIFKRAWFFFSQLYGLNYFYLIRMILFTINDLFAHSSMFSSIAMYH